MSHRCFEWDEFDDLVELDVGDPRHAEAMACPRCAARLAGYQRFAAGGAPPEGADLEDARGRLGGFVEREIVRAAGASATPREIPDRHLVDLWRRLTRPALRPVWASLAIVAVGAGIFVTWQSTRYGEAVLRGTPEYPAAGMTSGIESYAAEPAGGAVRLGWRAVEDAAEYRVHIYSAKLESLATLSSVADTVFTAGRETLRDLARPGDILYWRVVARRANGETLTSPARTLRVP